MVELGAFGDYRGVFVETTKTDHGHGGPGWEAAVYEDRPAAGPVGEAWRSCQPWVIQSKPCA